MPSLRWAYRSIPGGGARLQKIETVNVSPARLRLPAKPLTRAQILAELKARRDGGNAPPH
jgi:hypothetical protein